MIIILKFKNQESPDTATLFNIKLEEMGLKNINIISQVIYIHI
jgi:hypothetical protein